VDHEGLARDLFKKPLIKQEQQMNESSEFTDEFLHAQADIGDYHLDEEGFQYRPTQEEMNKLALEGQSLLFIDSLKRKIL
jgi:hypothetical protein